jgi:hypothetical protein
MNPCNVCKRRNSPTDCPYAGTRGSGKEVNGCHKWEPETLNPHIKAVADERVRQIEKEGFTEAHDARPDHAFGQLAMAACYYAFPEETQGAGLWALKFLFPNNWNPSWAKKESQERKRQLVIAAALLVAELDRLYPADAAPVQDYTASASRVDTQSEARELLVKVKAAHWWDAQDLRDAARLLAVLAGEITP